MSLEHHGGASTTDYKLFVAVCTQNGYIFLCSFFHLHMYTLCISAGSFRLVWTSVEEEVGIVTPI